MISRSVKVYRVAEITRLIKTVLEDEVGEVWVEGELSNLRRPTSGHWYFTLKDETAQVAGVMFRGNQRPLQFQPKDGLLVRVFGQLSVYEKSGQYQLIVRHMELAGQGALQAAFEALKRKLEAEGLFDPSRKKPIPTLVRHLGIVTSPTGAALRDMLNILSRRFRNLHIVLAPVRVQGEGAAQEIAEAIDSLNAWGGLDAMIVGRGGGSLEDLWAFNEESVARAMARSSIPIISAVGHEIDFTISDFVADLRAPTPSAAAELVVGQKADFEEALLNRHWRLNRALQQRYLELKNRFTAAAGSYVFREPGHMARRRQDQLRRLSLQLERALTQAGREAQQRLDEASLTLPRLMTERMRFLALEVRRYEGQLKALNPLAVLDRGYSITSDEDGCILRTVEQVKPGACVNTRLAQGTFESDVRGVTSE